MSAAATQYKATSHVSVVVQFSERMNILIGFQHGAHHPQWPAQMITGPVSDGTVWEQT